MKSIEVKTLVREGRCAGQQSVKASPHRKFSHKLHCWRKKRAKTVKCSYETNRTLSGVLVTEPTDTVRHLLVSSWHQQQRWVDTWWRQDSPSLWCLLCSSPPAGWIKSLREAADVKTERKCATTATVDLLQSVQQCYLSSLEDLGTLRTL